MIEYQRPRNRDDDRGRILSRPYLYGKVQAVCAMSHLLRSTVPFKIRQSAKWTLTPELTIYFLNRASVS